MGGFAWSTDGRVAVGVVAPDPEVPAVAELVSWQPESGDLRRVPCPGCAGAALTGDEVRTISSRVVHRYGVRDLVERGTMPVSLDYPADLPHWTPEEIERLFPPEVIAATEHTTVVKYSPAPGSQGGPDVAVGFGEDGRTAWRYESAGTMPFSDISVNEAKDLVAFNDGAQWGCDDSSSHPTVLDIDTGSARAIPGLPEIDPGHTGVADVWWNGDELVVLVLTARCEGESDPRVLTLGGESWQVRTADSDRAARVLPSGATLRAFADGRAVLKPADAGAPPIELGGGVYRHWTPMLAERVGLPA
ncbi:hypothetical protein JOD54_005948 [Actinokineospora baliensis]|uniref:hypothetical protein n=1 Tax=Actinokineospora baliensis TaxID=547056 RepID=UPI00195C4E5C|nr:hypothetical protein [Actinokineospora baliensis]MBM7775744.1 hypothetical protein [Actinokineospora baliensis]